MSAWADKFKVRNMVRNLTVSTNEVNADIVQVQEHDVRPDTPRPDRLRIGVDMGGVCVHKAATYENDAVEFKDSLNMEGCVDALRLLSDAGHTIVLVSFCGRRRANDTRDMLKREYPKLFDEVYFVKSTKFKHAIAESRGLDVMIDDRLDVLKSMPGVTPIHFIADVPLNLRDKKGSIFEAIDWNAVVTEVGKQRSKRKLVTGHSEKICY